MGDTARRQYSKGEWISAGVFMVVVLIVAASCWPSGSDTSSAPSDDRARVASSARSSRAAESTGGLAIARSSFTEWPFTVDAGTLRCEGGAVTFMPPGGPKYAVNGTAKGAGYPSVDPIWAEDTELGNGLKVDISEVLNNGLLLC